MEVTGEAVKSKKIINRGFLIGPYCPVYGIGVVLITSFLYRYAYDPIVLFVMTIVTCAVLEYLTSFAMEKTFKARWWDYSSKKFNINGRICLETTILFGIAGIIITYFTNPILISKLNLIPVNIQDIIAITLVSIFFIDGIISIFVIAGFTKTAEQVGQEEKQDNTEEITKKVKEILTNRSWMHRRLINAYPTVQTIKYKIKEIKDTVKESALEVKDNINEKAKEVKNNINDKKESVKNTLNEKKEEMKTTFTDTTKQFSEGFSKHKRRAKINIKIGKRKIKHTFRRKK